MKSFAAPEFILATLLLLSLGVKAAASTPAPEPDPRMSLAAAARLIDDAGFVTRIVHMERSPGALVVATRDECGLRVGEYPPHGTFRDVYRDLAGPAGRLGFAYRGSLHETEPKLRGLFDFYRWRELSRIGFEVPRAPILAVLAEGRCDLRALDWSRAALIAG